ncbi:hypothetical protein BCR44DRAFT_1434047 [Catenaria anguillulae PL171]|uniref:Uncharacterized protein n=1 Tax=Catenaria anguillulae PL171 TaxID=765915 RepID=A0A1Y2HRF1_9FUNG|nr:hypothetical protein BCR44DRAFT_1434047 [Catenaria anguillulae PL171]
MPQSKCRNSGCLQRIRAAGWIGGWVGVIADSVSSKGQAILSAMGGRFHQWRQTRGRVEHTTSMPDAFLGTRMVVSCPRYGSIARC